MNLPKLNGHVDTEMVSDMVVTKRYEKDGSSIVIGCVHGNVYIENNNVYADILLLDSYRDMWKGKYDNWGIILDDDNKSFKLNYIEVF